jgi:hypothetical protein
VQCRSHVPHDVDGCLWALDGGRLNLQMTGVNALLAGYETLPQQLIHPAFVRTSPTDGTVEKRAVAVGMREIDARVFTQQGMCGWLLSRTAQKCAKSSEGAHASVRA